MGINYCKQLGIKPSTTISAKDFDKIWKKYDESKTGFLDKKAARKFLKHFAEAVGTQYDEFKAQQLLRDVDPKGSGFITYEMFKKLFFEATSSIGQNRVGLTQSLQVKLSVKSTIWSKKAVLRTSNMSNANDEDREQLPEEVDDEYFILDQPIVAECPFKIITESELDIHMAEQEAEVSKILGIPVSDVALLIRLFGWDKEKLYARYFDDPEGFQKKAGILVSDTNPEIERQDEFECPVCCDAIAFEDTFALRCGHRYCNECWKGHLKSMVSSYGGEMLITHCKCMTSGCYLLVNKEHVGKLADEDSFKRYRYFFNKTFVEVHKRFTYCPAQCGHVVMNASEVKLKPKDVVECVCSKKFCFHCGLEYHNPVKCNQMKQWNKENEQDQESLNLVMAIAKPCPNPECGIPVDRTEGCNHMTCQKCGHEWCWQCRGAWKEHGERTGGFYFCNQYETSPAYKIDEEAERLREEHNRFLHFFNGWHVNDKDEKGCLTTLKPQLGETATKYQSQTGAETDFLFQALETLMQSRHLVKNSYIYAYFLPTEDTPQKKMFETQQAYAQEICERLSKELMNPIETLDRNKIVYLTKACQRYVHNLVDFFESEDGQSLYASMPKAIKASTKKVKDKRQQTAWWICTKCTFGNDPAAQQCSLCGQLRNN